MKSPSHKRTDFRAGGLHRLAFALRPRKIFALVLRSPSTARPLRCAYAPSLCLAEASFRLPGWGQGCAPARAFLARFASSLLRERGETEGRGGFTVSLSHFDLKNSRPRASLTKYRTRPSLKAPLCASFPPYLEAELFPGAPEGDLPPAPQGERGFQGCSGCFWQKEKAYILDVSLAQIQARTQHRLC